MRDVILLREKWGKPNKGASAKKSPAVNQKKKKPKLKWNRRKALRYLKRQHFKEQQEFQKSKARAGK